MFSSKLILSAVVSLGLIAPSAAQQSNIADAQVLIYEDTVGPNAYDINTLRSTIVDNVPGARIETYDCSSSTRPDDYNLVAAVYDATTLPAFGSTIYGPEDDTGLHFFSVRNPADSLKWNFSPTSCRFLP